MSFKPWETITDPRMILREQDRDLFDAIEAERRRQNEGIELIASENYISRTYAVGVGLGVCGRVQPAHTHPHLP